MKLHSFSANISLQMILVFLFQMIATSHLLPLSQHELDLMLDPVFQEQNESLEEKRVVAKSVFNVPSRTTASPIHRCPPNMQQISEGGPCKPTASSITVDYNLFDSLRKATKDSVRRKTGSGQRNRHRSTTTASPYTVGAFTSNSNRPQPGLLVHSQDSTDKQPAPISPSTAYVLQSPQEAVPLPMSPQMTNVHTRQPQAPENFMPVNNDVTPVLAPLPSTSTTTTKEFMTMTVSEDSRDLSTTASDILETTGLGTIVPEITESLAMSIMSSTTFKSVDETTDKAHDEEMQASSTVHVPQPFHMSSFNGSFGRDTSVPLNSINVNATSSLLDTNISTKATTGRSDRHTQDFFSPLNVTTNTEHQKLIPLLHVKEQDTTEKVWIDEEIKSTIEPPIAAEQIDDFSVSRLNSGVFNRPEIENTESSNGFTFPLITPQSTYVVDTTPRSYVQTEIKSQSSMLMENNFATTEVNGFGNVPETSSIATMKSSAVEEQFRRRQPIYNTSKPIEEDVVSTTTLSWSGERSLQPEVEVDFDLETASDVWSTDKTRQTQRIIQTTQPQTYDDAIRFRQSIPQPDYSKRVLVTHSQPTNHNPTPANMRTQNSRNRNSVSMSNVNMNPPHTLPRNNNQNNQFFIYDYLTFDRDRPKPSE